MTAALRLEGQLFLLALQFLTRLPLPSDLPWSDDLSVRATKYYPLVGVCVGAAGALALWLFALVFPPLVAVLLSLAITVVVTGGLHEDGMADCADGLGGGATRARALDIMKDSRLGSYGALALVLTVGLKVTALGAMPAWHAGWALIVGHAFGRMGAVHVIATTRYARADKGKFSQPGVTPDGYRVAMATAVLTLVGLVTVAGPVAAALAALLAIALAQGFRRIFMRKLDGYTGDCLGGVVVLCELGVYLGVLAWL